MQQYFIEQVGQLGAYVELAKDDAHHLLRVMRAKVGEEVTLVDSKQQVFRAKLNQIEGKIATLQLIEQIEGQSTELPVQVTIATGLSKHDKLDWVVQKGTELGMFAFMPIALQRDVVKWTGQKISQRQERLQKIAKEAAEQSHRQCIPQVHLLHSFKEVLAASAAYTHCLVAYEEVAKAGQHEYLNQALHNFTSGDSVLCVFGSEGGLTEDEVSQLKEHGFETITLGPRILRTETAPLYLLSCISFVTEMTGKKDA